MPYCIVGNFQWKQILVNRKPSVEYKLKKSTEHRVEIDDVIMCRQYGCLHTLSTFVSKLVL